MNKTKIKNFSIWARKNLIDVVAYRMRFLGIDENGIKDEMDGSTDKLKLYDMGTSKPAEVADKDIPKRVRLANHIDEHAKNGDYKTAYESVVEEIAYTWFNRLIAIRFMEVNDYLPSGVRVLSSENGKSEPDIVTQAVEVAQEQNFDISKDVIWKLKDENKLDELFRIMFIQQCQKLHEVLPELFDNSHDDYTALLLPISFIDKDGFIRHLVSDIDEDDFNLSKEGQIEIIGWLYQYYNSEKKDAVFASMSKKVKVTKENIPAATQLFTPDWIVQYMVENSLGRLWLDGHPDTSAKNEWKYFLEEAQQSNEVYAQLDEIKLSRTLLSPEQIRFIDPCMGSGHILVYAFDVFMHIYLSCGYTERDAVQSIVRYNLWGLDLDKRAYQLAYFAVMMKARQYDRRFLSRGITPNLSHFQDLPSPNYDFLGEPIKSFVEQFKDADAYGSLITLEADPKLDLALDNFEGVFGLNFTQMEHMVNLYKILSQKYDVVCTNPPYMGMGNANAILKSYVEKNFPDSKSDLFAVFIEKCGQLAKLDGYYAMITQHAFMFLSSYEKLREKLAKKTIVNMAHLGARAFDEIDGEVVQTTAFVNYNSHIQNYLGTYSRLVDVNGEKEKEQLYLSRTKIYTTNQENFSKIPGSPVAYWINDARASNFKTQIDSCLKCKTGLICGNNDKYIRKWFEICFDNIGFDTKCISETIDCRATWFPYNHGGERKKWYGGHCEVVLLYNNAQKMRDEKNSLFRNEKYYFHHGITWNRIGSGYRFASREALMGFVFDDVSPTGFVIENEKYYYILGYMNTKVFNDYLKLFCTKMKTEIGHIQKVPFIYEVSKKPEIDALVQENIDISKSDWDSFETSWDFEKHPLVRNVATVREAFEEWEQECEGRFQKLKANEEELNRTFIDIYGLQEELTPEVEERDVTVRLADLQREMRSLVSYAVGCMFGRYSLDRDGLVYAGGDFNKVYWKHKGQAGLNENDEPIGGGYAGISLASYNYPRFWNEPANYSTTPLLKYNPDADNCIPITEEPYFENDIVTQFARFIETVYGSDTLEENLRYIANGIGVKGGSTAREKIRQYFLKDFFKDHCKVYQKRPIYWQFDTGKKNGFKALSYVHRWNVNTVGDVRIDYMHKLQRLYRNEILRLQENIDAKEEIGKSQKRLEKITNQLKETEEYDAKMGMVVAAKTEIDLDDGVKVNYEKVQLGADGKKYDILAKV